MWPVCLCLVVVILYTSMCMCCTYIVKFKTYKEMHYLFAMGAKRNKNSQTNKKKGLIHIHSIWDSCLQPNTFKVSGNSENMGRRCIQWKQFTGLVFFGHHPQEKWHVLLLFLTAAAWLLVAHHTVARVNALFLFGSILDRGGKPLVHRLGQTIGFR